VFVGEIGVAQQPVGRGGGLVIAFAVAGFQTLFVHQFADGVIAVHQRFPAGAVEGIDPRRQSWLLEAFVAEELTHRHPVLLLDVGVVVFAIGPRAGEAHRHRSFLEVAHEVVVEELAAVVAIKTQEGKGQALFDAADLLEHAGAAPAPDRAQADPAGVEVGEGDGPDVLARNGVAAVGDRVGLDEAGPGHIPVLGADRDLFLEQRAGLGGGASFRSKLGPHRAQEPVDGRGAQRQQLRLDLGGPRPDRVPARAAGRPPGAWSRVARWPATRV
jgi:hypothetical protein